MKYYRTILISAISCLVLSNCGRKTEDVVEVIEVNFHDYVEKPISEITDKIFLEKRYVVLHADEQNMMLGEISKIVFHDDKMYIADSWSHKLIVHDMNGYAITRVGNRGRGPGEYLNISDFDVDGQGRIHLVDGNADKLLIYDADYKFVEVFDPPYEIDIIKCTPDGGYLLGLSSWDTSEYAGNRILKTKGDLSVEKFAGEFDKKLIDDNIEFSDYYFVEMFDAIFYQKSPEENVYQLANDGEIEKIISFNLGQYAIPVSDRGDLEPLISSGEITSYRALMNFAVPKGKYIYGVMFDRGSQKSYVYDIDNKAIYTKNNEEIDDFGNIIMINSEYLITLFPYMDIENLPSDLPEDMHQQVVDGDLLICMYKLK